MAKTALLKYNASRIILVLNDPSGDLVWPDETLSSFKAIGETNCYPPPFAKQFTAAD